MLLISWGDKVEGDNMSNKIDMTGWVMKDHGVPDSKLIVICPAETEKRGTYWKCKCECGNETIVRGAHLRDGRIKTCGKCGCKREDMTGWIMKEHGISDSLITVLKYKGTINDKITLWECKCECGKIFTARGKHIKNGHTKSCGKCDLLYKQIDLSNSNWKIIKDLGNKSYLCECSCEKHTQKILTRSQLLTNSPKYCDYCRPSPAIDIHNKKYNMLTAIEPTNKRQGTSVIWRFKCDCGEIVEYSAAEVRYETKYACPYCANSISKGEQKIKSILEKNNIIFEREKTFETCKSKNNKRLRFDFYLPEYNLVIEYDGKQHTTETEVFSHYSFKDLQENDKIKNEWCKNNNITMIRIPFTKYKDINIDLLLNKN